MLFGWSPCPVPLESAIYVSISDPLGEPAFKPSPTKPIPKWMQLLPSHWPDRIPWDERPTSVLDDHFPRPQLRCPWPHRPPGKKSAAQPKERSYESLRPLSPIPTYMSVDSTPKASRKGRPTSLVSPEPNIRPSSRQWMRRTDSAASPTCEKAFGPMPPPTPSFRRPVSPKQETPWTWLPRLAPIRPEPQKPPHQSQRALIVPAQATTVRRVGKSTGLRSSSGHSELGLPKSQNYETAPQQRQLKSGPPNRRTPPGQSSEFLDHDRATERTQVLAPPSLPQKAWTSSVRREMRRSSKGGVTVGAVSRETALASVRRAPSERSRWADGGGDGDGELEVRYFSVLDELRRVFRRG